MRILNKVLNGFVDCLAVAAGVLLCTLAVLICLEVSVRYLHLASLPWVFDFTEYLLYTITFAGAPWVLRGGGHISVDILVEALSAGAQSVLSVVTNAVAAATCLILAYLFCKVGWNSFQDGTMVHDTFVFPEWIIFSFTPFVFVAMAALFLRNVRERWSGMSAELEDIV